MRIRALVAGVLVAAAPSSHAQSGSTVTPDDYKRWRTELRNWGRWGPNDQKGTANLITPEKVQSAARLVRSGIVVSLAGAVPQQEAADVGPEPGLPPDDEQHRAEHDDRHVSGELSRPVARPHRRVLPFLHGRPDVQRLFREGEHHA